MNVNQDACVDVAHKRVQRIAATLRVEAERAESLNTVYTA